MSKFAPFEYAFSPILLNLLATTFYGYFKVVLSLKKFYLLLFCPDANFKFWDLKIFIAHCAHADVKRWFICLKF